jgi:hypothetical protein
VMLKITTTIIEMEILKIIMKIFASYSETTSFLKSLLEKEDLEKYGKLLEKKMERCSL